MNGAGGGADKDRLGSARDVASNLLPCVCLTMERKSHSPSGTIVAMDAPTSVMKAKPTLFTFVNTLEPQERDSNGKGKDSNRV